MRDKIRTRDLLVRSQTLYPAELPTQSVALSATRSIIQPLDDFVNILFKNSVFSEGTSTDVLWNSPTNLSELPRFTEAVQADCSLNLCPAANHPSS